MSFKINPIFNTDAYKVSHKGFTPDGTTKIYSNFTPRSSKYMQALYPQIEGNSVFFGLQFVIKNILIDQWNENFFQRDKGAVIAEARTVFKPYLGDQDLSHFEALHDLGYLPIEIKALPEGSLVQSKIPFLTIVNTNDDYAWLTNYLETILSSELWKIITVATIGREFRKLGNDWATKTTGSTAGTEFQFHDFSFRGQSNSESAASLGAAFLLSSNGSDAIPALPWLEYFYNVDLGKEFVAATVNASEHSVTCLGSAVTSELDFFRKAVTQDYPTGIVSLVSDTYDYWKVLTDYLPALKDDILARKPDVNGLSKVVIRPDSGNPVDIICGQNILDFTSKCGSFEDFQDWAVDWLVDNEQASAGHGECGDYQPSGVFKYQDKYYKVVAEIDWNRHDKQYYYVDGQRLDSIEEVKLTPEQLGSIELLWNVFGGAVNAQGFKVLDSHIGLIYGDSITFARAKEIFERLAAKGFASTNVVFGIGSYCLSAGISRDTLGMAIKATAAKVNGNWIELFKDPKTDDGTKKSAKGLLRIESEDGKLVLYDQQSEDQEQQGLLQTVFKDGKLLVDQKFSDIKATIWS